MFAALGSDTRPVRMRLARLYALYALILLTWVVSMCYAIHTWSTAPRTIVALVLAVGSLGASLLVGVRLSDARDRM